MREETALNSLSEPRAMLDSCPSETVCQNTDVHFLSLISIFKRKNCYRPHPPIFSPSKGDDETPIKYLEWSEEQVKLPGFDVQRQTTDK